MTRIKVEHPDWLESAVDDHLTTLRLLKENKIPDVLIGQFVVTMCMRFLRSIYGDDLSSALAVRQWVLDREQERMEDDKVRTDE